MNIDTELIEREEKPEGNRRMRNWLTNNGFSIKDLVTLCVVVGPVVYALIAGAQDIKSNTKAIDRQEKVIDKILLTNEKLADGFNQTARAIEVLATRFSDHIATDNRRWNNQRNQNP